MLRVYETDSFCGWAVTAVDSIDTMILMNLTEEYDQVREHVKRLDFTNTTALIPFFETTIRYTGGLLSAYYLKKDPIFLTRADDIAKLLLTAFNSTSGLPNYGVDPVNKQHYSGMSQGTTLLAEMASCQMEYKYLAYLTKRPEYYQAVSHTSKILPVG